MRITPSSGCRSSIRGLLQGVLVLQTVEPRAYSEDVVGLLRAAGAQVAPIVSEARTLGQFLAPAHRRLSALAANLWWSWDAETTSLFRDLDPRQWRALAHNPIALLQRFTTERLESRVLGARPARPDQPLVPAHAGVPRVHADVGRAPCRRALGAARRVFSAEFGLHESLPIYSGGLGVLAGDHIKAASDLGLPLVGVGLYYEEGYFRQRLDHDGRQQEEYLDVDRTLLPIERAKTAAGEPVRVTIDTRGGPIAARVWKLAVGRNMLLLLDTDVEGNRPEDRELSSRLYGGDHGVRIRQELLLGVGGVRALAALDIIPGVVHLNEGHSAFAALELARQRMEREGIGVDEAMSRVSQQVVFTTHTPVPAGHDRFTADAIDQHLGPLGDALGLDLDRLMGLGRVNPSDGNETFCMTVLALKLSRKANAVSSLHGEVSRAMWTSLYPGVALERVPIGHITNGVHVPSWLAPPMRRVFDRHLGPDWPQRSADPGTWDAIETLDAGELWETHQLLKNGLIAFARRRVVDSAEKRGEAADTVDQLATALSLDALTIGFARRFATYKRANLVLRDIELLASLVNDPQRPIQFLFAGKAHPLDGPGKDVLQEVSRLMFDPRFAGKILFVEDYDINVGRHLVQGVDVWLNTPRRPLEASGTSGQKVVLNGGLNCSVLDGWWAEAFDGLNGFAIGRGETHSSVDVHDERDAEALRRVLCDEIIPLYYDRDDDGLPKRWIGRMKRAIRTLGWRFSADRMVTDYVLKAYVPAAGGTSSDLR
jgi:starch phosphorylase